MSYFHQFQLLPPACQCNFLCSSLGSLFLQCILSSDIVGKSIQQKSPTCFPSSRMKQDSGCFYPMHGSAPLTLTKILWLRKQMVSFHGFAEIWSKVLVTLFQTWQWIYSQPNHTSCHHCTFYSRLHNLWKSVMLLHVEENIIIWISISWDVVSVCSFNQFLIEPCEVIASRMNINSVYSPKCFF